MVVYIILAILFLGIAYFVLSADPKELKTRAKNRSAEQKTALKYFLIGDGCQNFLKKKVKDEEYDALVATHIAKLKIREKALSKIGLDEDQIKEIEPVHFEGYYFDNKKTFSKLGKDDKYRSSAYQVSWLFFSSTQVYLYQNTFNLDEDGKKEITEEYFYKDITNLSTSSDTVETQFWDFKKMKIVLKNVDSNRFRITVPGDSLYCQLDQNDYTERAIQGMKAKLREKKNQ